MLRSLRLLHRNGIAHRDIKAANFVVIEKSSEVLMIDLGSALCAEMDQFSGYDAIQIGTSWHIPPEIRSLKPDSTYDANKADVYSLGVMIAGLACGTLVPNVIDKDLAKSNVAVFTNEIVASETETFIQKLHQHYHIFKKGYHERIQNTFGIWR